MKITVFHQVAFNEMDPMGVVWHGNYVNYFELARSALLAKIGLTYTDMQQRGHYWPVVKLRCKYIKSATLNQRLAITAELKDYTNSLTMSFIIRDAESGDILTKGETMQMAVDGRTGSTSIVNPDYFIELVNAAQAAELSS
ncbi:MAG: acyl-CoA thioesterase [Akkermansia sp.]|nr:acyl-CoA thioesterase [Akkermansia sp.]